MIDGMFAAPGMVGLQDGLAWLSARRNAISQNLANADTPGYRPIDVRLVPGGFGAALATAGGTAPGGTGSGGGLGGGPGGGAGGGAGGGPSLEVVAATDGPQRLDGNGVNVDAEMARLSQTQLWYAADAKTLEMAFARLRTAMQ